MEAEEGRKRSMRIEEVDEDRRGSLPHSCRMDGRMDGTVGRGEIEGSSSRGEGAGDAKGWHPQGPILNCSGHRGSAPWNRVGRCNHRLDEASTSRQLAGGHADPERAKDSR